MKVHRPILVALVGSALAGLGCFQGYVARKQVEAKQHFLKVAAGDQICHNAVEKDFDRCWNEGMGRLEDTTGVKTIVACLNRAAGKDCFETPN